MESRPPDNPDQAYFGSPEQACFGKELHENICKMYLKIQNQNCMTTKYKTSYENLEASLPENLVVEEYLLTAVGVSRFGLEALFFTDVLVVAILRPQRDEGIIFLSKTRNTTSGQNECNHRNHDAMRQDEKSDGMSVTMQYYHYYY